MAAQMLRGTLVAVVDGPKMILEMRGQERSFPLDVDITTDWVQTKMDSPVTVLVKDGRVVQVT